MITSPMGYSAFTGMKDHGGTEDIPTTEGYSLTFKLGAQWEGTVTRIRILSPSNFTVVEYSYIDVAGIPGLTPRGVAV